MCEKTGGEQVCKACALVVQVRIFTSIGTVYKNEVEVCVDVECPYCGALLESNQVDVFVGHNQDAARTQAQQGVI